MNSKRDVVTKIPMITGVEDFVNWKRRAIAYLQNQDYELLGMSDRPERASSAMARKRQETNASGNTSITLTLADGTLSQDSTIIDEDERTAKDLWEELDKIFRM